MSEIEFGVVPENKPRVVSEAPVARKLIKDGYKVIDIKPKRGHSRETVFVFEAGEGFAEKVEQYTNERKERRAEKTEE